MERLGWSMTLENMFDMGVRSERMKKQKDKMEMSTLEWDKEKEAPISMLAVIVTQKVTQAVNCN